MPDKPESAEALEWSPCPFCGSTDTRYDPDIESVYCLKCHATGPSLLKKDLPDDADDDSVMGDAVRLWNGRAARDRAIREAAIEEAARVCDQEAAALQFNADSQLNGYEARVPEEGAALMRELANKVRAIADRSGGE